MEGKRRYRRCGGQGAKTHLPRVRRFRGNTAHLPKVGKGWMEGKRRYRRCGGHGAGTHLPKAGRFCGGHGAGTHLPKAGRFCGKTAHLPKVGKGWTERKRRYRCCGGHGAKTHLPKAGRFRGNTAHLRKVGRVGMGMAGMKNPGCRRCGGRGLWVYGTGVFRRG